MYRVMARDSSLGCRAVRFACWLVVAAACTPAPRTLQVGTTTSVEASGLLATLQPVYERESGLRLRFIVVGSGQALRLLERGDVEGAITHDPEGEKKLVERGVAQRKVLMHNEFVLLGPAEDPARVRGMDAVQAFGALASAGAPFVSRGDDSGTHRAEKRLWEAAGATTPWPGYRETGQGMGETLVVAGELSSYTLVDSSTLLTFRSRVDLTVLARGDARLQNSYSALWRTEAGERFATWLGGDEARALMRPLFEPADD
jgi:tungstate transport system substrate-binding protein